jgi:hypothetical protein
MRRTMIWLHVPEMQAVSRKHGMLSGSESSRLPKTLVPSHSGAARRRKRRRAYVAGKDVSAPGT